MLSYQHQYHAGNHADVLKHWLLLECVHYLQRKETPFDYIDTHAGAGYYPLKSREAQKTREIYQGVLKLNWDEHPLLETYRDAVLPALKKGYYPGSPLLVKQRLRPQDRAWLFELHPQTVLTLKRHLEQPRQCFVRQEDGFGSLLALLPSPSRRALVMIDPSYEVKQDYKTVVKTLDSAYKKMPQATLLLWYPVVDRSTITRLEADVRRTSLRNVQLFELGVAPDDEKGMSASGLVVVNPPWTLAETFQQAIPELCRALTTDGVLRWRHEQLVAE